MPIEKLPDQRDGEGESPWIRTADGGRFYYLDYDGSQYNIDVAAASLSRLCRYAGHLSLMKPEFDDDIYSVAQHSVYVFRLLKMLNAPKYTYPWAIAHDVPEAYFLDLVSPLKGLIPDYGIMEDRSANSFRNSFGIPYDATIHEYVKWADYQLYFAERIVLTEVPKGDEELTPMPDHTLEEIDPNFYLWRPKYAREQFKLAFIEAMTLYRGEKYADAS